MSCNDKVRVSVLPYYNAFMVIDMERTYYWYSDREGEICTEDYDEMVKALGNVLLHNQAIVALAVDTKSGFYFANTRWHNIIARSDGWYRDFGSEDVLMYPKGYDFDAKCDYDFITSTLLDPWKSNETSHDIDPD